MARRVYRHWLALAMIGVTLTIGSVSLINAVQTVGRPFAGFFVGPNQLVAIGQREGWPGIQGGLRSLDRITAIDGRGVESGSDILGRIESAEPDALLRYEIERKDSSLSITVPVTRYRLGDFLVGFLAPFVLGLLFLAFGGILYFAQPNARGSLLYLVLCCTVAVFCLTIFEAYTSFTFFRLTLMYPIIGAFSAHLFSLLPGNQPWRWRIRTIVISLYVFAAALIVWRQAALADAGSSVFLSRMASAYILIVLMVDLLLLTRAYQRATSQIRRDRVKVLVIGLIIASSIVAAWSLNFLFVTRSFYLDEGVLLASVFPVFMAYAILRRNIFGLDRVIRLSLSYGVGGAAILALYLGVIGAAKHLMPALAEGRDSGWLLVGLAIAGALLFNLVRRRINQAVHRFLFRNQYDVEKGLAELDRELSAGLSKRKVAERVSRALRDLLQVERSALVFLSGRPSEEVLGAGFGWPEPQSWDAWIRQFGADGFLDHLRKGQTVSVSASGETLAGSFERSSSFLAAHGVEIVVPLASPERLLGWILLGPKSSHDRFESNDFEFLSRLARRLDLFLENLRLTAESDRASRLAALGEMASVMIHDIKNPIATIKTAAGSLRKNFSPGATNHELSTIIIEEVDRMNHTIGDILSFAKPAGLSVSVCPVSKILRGLSDRWTPRFAEEGVRLDVDPVPDDLCVEADPDRLHRALENLLANALEATPSGGRVRLEARAEIAGNGRDDCILAVEDTGPGIETAVRERMFQPFFTTKAGGTGLGLAIVQQVVAEHRGELIVESRPGAGTRFALRIPARAGLR